MSTRTAWETFKVEGGDLLYRVREILAQGNARRIVIEQKGRKIAEFPLTIGVVGAVFAPVLAAVGALATLLSKCSIKVERVVPEEKATRSTKAKKSRSSRSARS